MYKLIAWRIIKGRPTFNSLDVGGVIIFTLVIVEISPSIVLL